MGYLVFLLIVTDQLSKWWMVEKVMKGIFVKPITSFLNLVLTYNKGVSFGLLQSHTKQGRYFLIALACGLVAFLIYSLKKAQSKYDRVFFTLIISGAVGNIIDRFIHKGVVDFIDFHMGSYHWPAFNLADTFIFIGVMGILGRAFLGKSS